MKIVSFPGLGINGLKVNSVCFTIGSLQVTWYSVIITTGILLAALYVWFRFKEAGLSTDDLIDFALFVVPSGIIGARLYYVLFKLEYYLDDPKQIFMVWEGGLAIYGGIITGGIAAVLVARHKKIKMLKILDMLAPAVMMAQALGRWGNFANVEAFGGPTRLPWRMCSKSIEMDFISKGLVTDVEVFNEQAVGAHPTFLYESLWNIIGFLVIYFVFVRKKNLHKIDGQIFYSYLIWYGLGRLWIEGLRTDSLYLIEDVIRVSQLVALLSFLAGIGLMIWGFNRYLKYGKGKMILVIEREQKDTKTKGNNKAKSGNFSQTSTTNEVKNNGTNNKRKRSGSKGKRKHKK